MTDEKQLRPSGPGDPNPFHYFHMDRAPSDTKLEMAIHQGYVPSTCLLAGVIVWDEVNASRNPCWGCEGPRERCKGKPRRTPEVQEALAEVREGLKAGLKPLVGFPKGDNLYQAVRRALEPVLARIVEQRPSPITVICDRTNNTEHDAALGVLNVRLRIDHQRATDRELELWDRLTRNDL